MRFIGKSILLATILFWFVTPRAIFAKTKETANKDKDGSELLRKADQVYDLQQNSVSNLQFYTTNYGIYSYNIKESRGGGFWPRGTENQYIFAGGVWFGAVKNFSADGINREPRTYVAITYNPNNGRSWMVPGRIEDGAKPLSDSISKYRTYFSTDFRPDGAPIDPKDGENWPIWDTDPSGVLKKDRYFGRYVYSRNDRTKTVYPKGPAFISGEDIFATYKDTDLSKYDDGENKSRTYGYPLRLQYEQMIYSWGFGEYKDFIFMKYDIINKSIDTLTECWMAPVMDVDIALRTNSQTGADNDRARFYDEEDSLNLAFQWSEGSRGEAGRGFGYLGFDFLESPATYPAKIPVDTLKSSTGQDSVIYRIIGTSQDSAKFVRKDKKFYTNDEQLGLRTFKNWSILEDFQTEKTRYDAMSAGRKEGDNGPGDKRFMMATGPFNLLPGDTARVVVGIIMANSASGKDATGAKDDVTQLVIRDKFAQTVYDNNFQAPRPPDLSFMTGNGKDSTIIKGWKGINHGVVITWDSSAEVSVDTLERGLDFLGYRLYRAQRTENQGMDTFDIDNRPQQRKGPLGWKQIARWELPKPFLKSSMRPGGTDNNDSLFTQMDSLIVLRQIDSLTYKVARIGYGTQVQYSYQGNRIKTIDTIFFFSDFSAGAGAPWSEYYKNIASTKGMQYLIDSVWSGEIVLDPALVGRNTTQSPFIPLPNFNANPQNPRDSAAQEGALSAIIKYVLAGKGKLQFTRRATDSNGKVIFVDRDFERDSIVRYHVITKYMDSITNHRTFVDYGDDDRNGIISETNDIATTEKLINNLDYYYLVRAYDEGDYLQATPSKLNGKVPNVNQVRTTPLAAAVGNAGKLEIISIDSSKFGGLYNFRFDVRDEERLRQLYGGDTIEVEFQPSNGIFTLRTADATPPPGAYRAYYGENIIVRNISKDITLGNYFSYYEPAQCGNSIINYFAESSALLDPDFNRWKDSVGYLGSKDSIFEINRKGIFKTDVECLRSQRLIQGIFGFAFDYVIQQQGGNYRPYSVEIHNSDGTPANPVIGFVNDRPRFTMTAEQGSPFKLLNKGPVQYQIVLKPGDIERMVVTTKKGTFTFNVPYDNVEVKNTLTYIRNTQDGNVQVKYPDLIPHQQLTYPDGSNAAAFLPSENLGVGFFNISAFGWVNPGTGNNVQARQQQAADTNSGRPVGQGRYYHDAISEDGKDTLRFTHFFSGSGVSWMIDYANKQGRRQTRLGINDSATTTIFPAPTHDLSSGDTVLLRTYGGALGLPIPGAKIRARVTEMTPVSQVTDDMMDRIMVVPNPYYVSHVAQRSSYDAKIFFTRLPERCTITIYTINGDLVRTIEHNEQSEQPDKESVDIWDLQSSNRQQAASQVLIAKIETPDGSSTIKKFSIVTTGFRQVGQ